MLYLAIDQHSKQLTVCLRNEEGDVIQRRQVSTRWEPVRRFFSDLAASSAAEGGFAAIVEICGFNHWLLELLKECGCRQVILVQPESKSRQKTDRRDAHQLGAVLWVNRQRLLAGKRVDGLRAVQRASPDDEAARQLTELRKRLGQHRTRTINGIQHILLKHNLQQDRPTKGSQTKRARQWLRELKLPPIDRLELDQLLEQWKLWDKQLETVNAEIERRQKQHPDAAVLATIPGTAAYSSLSFWLPGSVASSDSPVPRAWPTTGAWRPAPTARASPGGSVRSPNKAARTPGLSWANWYCTY